MLSNEQAQRACILCEFLTSKNLPIRVFRYSEDDRIIRIEAGFRDKQIKTIINENGRFKFV